MYNNTYGYDNCAFGFNSLYSNTSGIRNTAIGTHALYSTNNSGVCVGIGYQALYNNVTGNGSTAVGAYTGLNSYYSENTFIGAYADANLSSYSHSTAIGYGATISGDYQVRLGDANVTSIGGYVGWTTYSDKRIKKDIQETVPGLAFINRLTPVTYHYDLNAIDQIIARSKIPITASLAAARAEKERKLFSGFLSQDVQKAAQEIGYEFSGVDKAQNDHDLYGLRYAEFVVPLVKAAQELNADQETLKAVVAGLKDQVIAALKNIDDMKAVQSNCCPSVVPAVSSAVKTTMTTAELSSARLEQNAPNPFSSTTRVRFHLPKNVASGQIVITNSAGQTVKSFAVSSAEEGVLIIPGNTLPAGTYIYSLFIGGVKIDSKQMIVTR